MPDTIHVFKVGHFDSLELKQDVRIGELPQLNLKSGMVVQYDGRILRVSGEEFPCLTFRSAVNVGWAVPTTKNVPTTKESVVAPKPVAPVAPPARPRMAETTKRFGFVNEERAVGVATRNPNPEKTAGVAMRNQPGEFKPNLISLDDSEKSFVGAAHVAHNQGARATSDGTVVATLPKKIATRITIGDSLAADRAIRDVESAMNRMRPVIAQGRVASAEVIQSEDTEYDMNSEISDEPAPAIVEPESTSDSGKVVELAPGFTWDMTGHWKTRVKQALLLRNDPAKLALVLKVEIPAVVNAVAKVSR